MGNKRSTIEPGEPEGWGMSAAPKSHIVSGHCPQMEKEESPKAFLLHFRICLMPYSASTART